MNLSKNAIEVLEKRYLAKDINGKLIEDPEGMFRRVAKAIAVADGPYLFESAKCEGGYEVDQEIKKIEDEFYDLMANMEFLPNSPTLMNAGRPLGQLSACFVLPIEDTMEGIFDSIKNAALIHKSGGGTGFSFSRLRAKNSPVNSTGGVASGPVSFMKVFNASTEAVKQGGTRRGANMGVLRVDHPDIVEFISCKQNNKDITNFNISVGLTEKFMDAVKKNMDYDLIDPKTKKAVGTLNAKYVFDLIVEMAYRNGDPGILFLDRVNKGNLTPELGEIESTNPCGEQPLLPYEACNLGSINLNVIHNPEKKNGVDYQKLKRIVHSAVHFLDNVIDVNHYPLPEIERITTGTRKIGLGIMGWANLLCRLKIPYNSDAAIVLAEDIMGFIQEEATQASIELAKTRGPFLFWEKSIYKNWATPPRNAATTTIAPTGTLSMIADVSSGCEPMFAIAYIKNVMDNTELYYVDPVFEETYLKEKKLSKTSPEYLELLKFVSDSKKGHGMIKNVIGMSKLLKSVFVTAHEISPEWHVKMQAAFQKNVQSAVSKTVNLSNDATREDVANVYRLADELGCKGVTIYRDGSRDMQVLNIGEVNGKEKPAEVSEGYSSIRNRPEVVHGITKKWKIGCGNLYVTVNYDSEGICEIFTNLGRAGGCPSQSEGTSRLASLALRGNIDPMAVIEQLKGIRCMSTVSKKKTNPDIEVMSCPDAIGKTIEMALKEIEAHKLSLTTTAKETAAVKELAGEKKTDKNNGLCQECGKPVEHEGGCMICRSCGFSKCG